MHACIHISFYFTENNRNHTHSFMDMNVVGLKQLNTLTGVKCVCVFMLKINNLTTLPSINPVSPTSFFISLMSSSPSWESPRVCQRTATKMILGRAENSPVAFHFIVRRCFWCYLPDDLVRSKTNTRAEFIDLLRTCSTFGSIITTC